MLFPKVSLHPNIFQQITLQQANCFLERLLHFISINKSFVYEEIKDEL